MGRLWPCPQFRRPDWKGFPRTNGLTYSASLSAMKETSFIRFPPVVLSKENLFFVLMFCQHWQHCPVVAAVDVVVVVAVEETVAAVIDQLYE